MAARRGGGGAGELDLLPVAGTSLFRNDPFKWGSGNGGGQEVGLVGPSACRSRCSTEMGSSSVSRSW